MKERSNINRDSFDGFDDQRTSSKSADRPFSRILQEIVDHLTEIVRSELRLAKTEIRQDVTTIAKASAFVAAAGLLLFYALGFILLAAVYGLATVLAPWLSALIVGVGVGIVGAILFQIGRTRIRGASLKPDETIKSVQENVTSMKKQIE